MNMKKIILLSLAATLVLGIFSCRKKGEQPESLKIDAELLKDTTVLTFLDSTTFYFDTINQGDKVEHTFHIKNTGDKNLVIARAFGSCGCTVPEYPKDPIKPGGEAPVKVTFNSAGKEGAQTKTVTIVCNTAIRNEILYMKGFVKTEDDKDSEDKK